MLYLSLSIISLNLLALLARYFFGELVGIDVNITGEGKRIEPNIKLEKQSIDDTNFEDETFSFIFSYHVLEHVDDPVKALKELHRIMKNGAVLFIGFPNKHRIVGYIGSQNDVSITDKILWNLND